MQPAGKRRFNRGSQDDSLLVDDAPSSDDAAPTACCAGGICLRRILAAAYRRGIFRGSRGQPILWWTPDPRMVLFPAEFRISRSLRKTLRRAITSSVWTATSPPSSPPALIRRAKRSRAPGSPRHAARYRDLHELGWRPTRSETWRDGELVGGLYGLTDRPDVLWRIDVFPADGRLEIAAAHLACFLESRDFGMVDCQMHRPSRLARRPEIPRSEFVCRLDALCSAPANRHAGRWTVRRSIGVQTWRAGLSRLNDSELPFHSLQFYSTSPHTCSYLPEETARSQVATPTHLITAEVQRTGARRLPAQWRIHLSPALRQLQQVRAGAPAGRPVRRRHVKPAPRLAKLTRI